MEFPRRNTVKKSSITLAVAASVLLMTTGCASRSGSTQDGDGRTAGDLRNASTVPVTLDGGAYSSGPCSTIAYFDFQEDGIRSSERAKLNDFARCARNRAIRIEGHADARGSRAFNQGLGERRAQAVQDYLSTQGVMASMEDIISYGEERPVDPAATEAAYQKNRRAELYVQ
jgi:peptidoglycan-associated lipoprotein